MEDKENADDYERKSMRNVARVISTAMAGIILLFAGGYLIEDLAGGRLTQEWTAESTTMAVYVILIALGSGLA